MSLLFLHLTLLFLHILFWKMFKNMLIYSGARRKQYRCLMNLKRNMIAKKLTCSTLLNMFNFEKWRSISAFSNTVTKSKIFDSFYTFLIHFKNLFDSNSFNNVWASLCAELWNSVVKISGAKIISDSSYFLIFISREKKCLNLCFLYQIFFLYYFILRYGKFFN